MRLIFMGTPDFAVPSLQALLRAGHDIAAAYTQPPRPAGRGMVSRKSPVQIEAEKLSIQVLMPTGFVADDHIETFRQLRADIAIVAAYGLILPPAILEAPRLGCINLHASLLPRWRGAAPINRAIIAGDTVSGASIMKMDEGLDSGPVYMQTEIPISGKMTAGELHDAIAARGAALLCDSLEAIAHHRLTPTAQAENGVSYAAKIDKAEYRINWREPARNIHNLIRGLSPVPGAWSELPIGERWQRVKILQSELCDGGGPAGVTLDSELRVGCGDGAIQVQQLQRAGHKRLSYTEFLAGTPISAGISFR